MLKKDRKTEEFLAQVRWHGFEFIPPKVKKTPLGREYLDARLRGVLFVKLEFIPGLYTVSATTSAHEKRYEDTETPSVQDIQDTVEALVKAYPLGSELLVNRVTTRYEDDVTSKKWNTTYFEVKTNTTNVPDFHSHLRASLLELVTPDNTEGTMPRVERVVRPAGKRARKAAAAQVKEEAKA